MLWDTLPLSSRSRKHNLFTSSLTWFIIFLGLLRVLRLFLHLFHFIVFIIIYVNTELLLNGCYVLSDVTFILAFIACFNVHFMSFSLKI